MVRLKVIHSGVINILKFDAIGGGIGKMNSINFMQIIYTKCDCCGEMVDSFSSRGEWFGKYLRPNEEKICCNCIKDREGYAEEFLEKIGVPLSSISANP